MIKHENDIHMREHEIIEQEFPSINDFEIFIKNLENATKSKYSIRNSRENYKLYACDRDKCYHKPENVLKNREPKLNNHKKFSCVSFISLIKKGHQISAKFCVTHSHEEREFFTKLSDEVKNSIAIKLKMGITESVVLNQVRCLFPTYIIQAQDVQNVKNAQKINCMSLDNNDKVSCEKFAKLNPNVVKFLPSKFHNRSIIVQSEYQKRLLQSTSQNKLTFGLDSTHCTTRYGFLLTTLHLIGDTKGEAVAHLISANEKEDTIKDFLANLSNQISRKIKHTLITDDFPAYPNAWKSTIGEIDHIQCLWHLKKNWRLKLNQCKITGTLNINI